MEQLGRQVLADAFQCDEQALNDPTRLEQLLRQATAAAGAQLIRVCTHRFHPQGVTAVAIISASHLAVHTWPEHRCAAIDAFTCGDSDPWVAVQVLLAGLGAGQALTREAPRGAGKTGELPPRELRRMTRFSRPSQADPGPPTSDR